MSTEIFSLDIIILYINPVYDEIRIKTINNDANSFVIYNVLVIKVLEGTLSEDKKIPFKQYSKGIYFLKLKNKQTIKFIKKII